MRIPGNRVRRTTGALVVLGSASLVAAGLARGRPGRSASSLSAADVSGVLAAVDGAVLTIGVVIAAGVAGLFLWAALRGTVPRDRSTMQVLRQCARFVLVTYLVVALLGMLLPQLLDRSGPVPDAGVEVASTGAIEGEAGAAWWPLALLVFASVGSLAVLRMLRQPPEPPTDDVADAARDAVMEALQALDDGRHVEDVVIAAYQRMEDAFGRRGLVRSRAETTAEFVTRVVTTLSVDEDAVRRLAGTYEHARFGNKPVDEAGRSAVRDLLARLLREVEHA